MISEFRLLVTKAQKDNQMKTKNRKETNQVLEVFREEYQKLHHENETWKKKIIEQQEELQKSHNQVKNQITSADDIKLIWK